MTLAQSDAHHAPADLPRAGTPVLLTRPLRPGARCPSAFADDRWQLSAAFFEEHISSISLNFASVPEPFKATAKHYVRQLLDGQDPPVLRRISRRQLAVRTVVPAFPSLTSFLLRLDVRAVPRLAGAGPADLDAYLADLLDAGLSRDTLGERISAVRRLWARRDRLPPGDRLPPAPPWHGRDAGELTGRKRPAGENRTPRIPAATMDRLLPWSLRFAGDFAAGILAIRGQYAMLLPRSDLEDASTTLRAAGTERQALTEFYAHVINELSVELDRVTAERDGLPGNVHSISMAPGRRSLE